MGSVILYCRNHGCGASYGSVGDLPVHCPTCRKPTRWSTSPPHAQVPANPALTISENDLKFLKALKIDPS
jgi:hypothetical protein